MVDTGPTAIYTSFDDVERYTERGPEPEPASRHAD
jgi:hypothetical protein